jgi:predicted DNA-binding transcriptional regulator YafY
MVASLPNRIDRLKLIENLLPSEQDGGKRGPTIAELLQKLEQEPGFHLPTRRTLERDLRELCKEGRVCALAQEGGPNRYQRVHEPFEFDPTIWEFLLKQLEQDLDGMMSADQFAHIMHRLQLPDAGIALDDSKLRILPDSLRLRPAPLNPKVLGCVLRALASGSALRVSYQDRLGKHSKPVLHPLGLLQRGPRVYLYAMKNDETSDRMYALDRIAVAECLPVAARQMADFSLDQRIADGRADFANGEVIQLKAVVRGYIETLLYDCPFNDSQQLVPLDGEEEGALLTVELPSSGQLLRWILAGGENVTVLEPVSLRDVVLGQVNRISARYRVISEFESKI